MTITLTFTWWDLPWISLAVLYLLWWNFIATMRVRELWPTLTRTNKVLAFLPVVFSFLQDILANLVIATVLALELPRPWTLTERFKRWKTLGPSGPRRAGVATRACKHINQFDPGHC